MIFAFTDQDQQHLVQDLDLEPCEQYMSMVILKETECH